MVSIGKWKYISIWFLVLANQIIGFQKARKSKFSTPNAQFEMPIFRRDFWHFEEPFFFWPACKCIDRFEFFLSFIGFISFSLSKLCKIQLIEIKNRNQFVYRKSALVKRKHETSRHWNDKLNKYAMCFRNISHLTAVLCFHIFIAFVSSQTAFVPTYMRDRLH